MNDSLSCEHVLQVPSPYAGEMCGKLATHVIYCSDGHFIGYRCRQHMKQAIMKRPKAVKL